ncbi:hypothetical protein KY334_05765 [Candidatus Woesearchaeota archaeon]|nr:hypothetical protein [Candidatus Woesearchaeota archaeon]
MTIAVEQVKTYNIRTENYEANVSLASSQYCAVAPVSAASGKMKVGLPSGQGVLCRGIVQNAPAAGAQANVMQLGRSKAKAASTFNSGVELTPSGTTGTLEAASSGDYVIAISVDASTCANAIVVVDLVHPFQKN